MTPNIHQFGKRIFFSYVILNDNELSGRHSKELCSLNLYIAIILQYNVIIYEKNLPPYY